MMLCLNAGSVVKLVVGGSEFQTLITLRVKNWLRVPQLQFEYAVNSFWVLRKSRPKEILILGEAIQAKNMSLHKVHKLSRLHTVYTFEYASTTHNEYFLFTVWWHQARVSHSYRVVRAVHCVLLNLHMVRCVFSSPVRLRLCYSVESVCRLFVTYALWLNGAS